MKFVVLIVTILLLALFAWSAHRFMNKNVRTTGTKDNDHIKPEEPADVEVHGDPEPKEKADYSSYEKKPRRQAKKKQ